MIDAETMLDRILAAENLQELDSVRVALLGKQGEITTRLKSLGSMDADRRAAEAPGIHALREQVTGAITDRKAANDKRERLERERSELTIELAVRTNAVLDQMSVLRDLVSARASISNRW